MPGAVSALSREDLPRGYDLKESSVILILLDNLDLVILYALLQVIFVESLKATMNPLLAKLSSELLDNFEIILKCIKCSHQIILPYLRELMLLQYHVPFAE